MPSPAQPPGGPSQPPDGPRIAVIIPCFNDGEFVAEAVQSVNEKEPVEIVLVDDASTDPATQAALDRLEAEGVHVIRRPHNGGVSATRMTGLAATSAPYVFPLDADDRAIPGALGTLADLLDANPEAGVCFGDYLEFGDEMIIRGVPGELDPYRLAYTNEYPASAMFRRTMLEAVGGWRRTTDQLDARSDWSLWMSLAERDVRGLHAGHGFLTYGRRLHHARLGEAGRKRHRRIYRTLRRQHATLFENVTTYRARSPMGRLRTRLYPLIYGGRYRWPFESRLKAIFDILGVWTLQRRMPYDDRERLEDALRSGRWLGTQDRPAEPEGHPRLASSRRIARNAILRSGGEVIAKLGSAAFFIAMARVLAPSDFGDFNFVFAMTTVLMFASGFGTEDLIVRDIARDRSRLDAYLTNIMLLKLGSTIALLLVAEGIVIVAGYGTDVRTIVFLVGGGVALQSFQRTLHSVFQAYERMGPISIALIIERMFTAGIGIAVLAAGGGLVAASVVFFGGAVIGLVVAAVILWIKVVSPRWALDFSRWLPLIRAAIPIGMSSVFFILLLKLDQTLLGLLKGGASDNTEVGFYGAAFRLIETTMFLSWSFGGAILPWLSRNKDSDQLALGYELGLKGLVAVLMPIGVGLVVLAEPIIHLLYGTQYDAAVEPLRWLGMMTVFYGINTMAVMTLIACHRPAEFTRILVVVAVVNIASNLLLIPPYGANGAAFSALLSSTLLGVLSVWRTGSVVGRIRLVRTFAGPVAGGLAMAAAVLLVSEPLLPDVALALGVYVIGLASFEWFTFREDLRMGIEVLGARRPQATVRPPVLSEL